MNPSSSIRIHGIHYTLPERRVGLEQLAAEGRLSSPPETMRDFGFGDCRVSTVPATQLASVTLKALLERHGVEPLDVGLLINASVLPTSALVPRGAALAEYPTGDDAHLGLFRFSSARLQDELGLSNARTVGLSELGCVSLSHAVWMAHALMEMEDLQFALCVSADVFPEGLKREVVYNVCSDSACAVLLSRHPEGLRLKTYQTLTRGYYWDPDGRQNELLAAYFPTGKRVLEKTLKASGLTREDIRLLIPHNVSLRSWEILSRFTGIPLEKIYTENIRPKGHSVAADNWINLKDVIDRGLVKPGDHVMMFSFGLGAHWGCSILQV
jgi:3-oxoacyl-[acyl-carrier-protein] synthase-3